MPQQNLIPQVRLQQVLLIPLDLRKRFRRIGIQRLLAKSRNAHLRFTALAEPLIRRTLGKAGLIQIYGEGLLKILHSLVREDGRLAGDRGCAVPFVGFSCGVVPFALLTALLLLVNAILQEETLNLDAIVVVVVAEMDGRFQQMILFDLAGRLADVLFVYQTLVIARQRGIRLLQETFELRPQVVIRVGVSV